MANNIFLIGFSGSGKSTLLKILLRITSITKGLIEYKNQDLKISYLGHKNAIKNYARFANKKILIVSDEKLNFYNTEYLTKIFVHFELK